MARQPVDPTLAQEMQALVAQYLRPWTGYYLDDATGGVVFEFDPPLTTAEQAIYSDLATMARFGVQMTLAEWQSVKSDAALLRTYYQNASPTNAQSVAAIKSVIHVLSVIVRS